MTITKTVKQSTIKKGKIKKGKYNNDICEDEMSFQDCELAILRHAIDESSANLTKPIANGEEVARMISIVQDFLIKKKLVCYGGTAINNILPKHAQFYDNETEIPDYDFYSANALQDAKELADNFFKQGYGDVEAKSGVHFGTYKVFVNFIPMADITLLPQKIFDTLQKEAITIAGIYYAPANFLRMNMFLELSRPAGDISRWEKVLKRLTLLNTYHSFNSTFTSNKVDCGTVDFQRKMSTNTTDSEKIYIAVRDTFIDLGVVFFGGYAISLYAKHMPKKQQQQFQKIPDFDVLSEEPDKTAIIIVEKLSKIGIQNITVIKHEEIGEIIPYHVELRVGKETVAFIYKPNACLNYNTITVGSQEINIATIDTMLTFYLAFYYVDKPYYNRDRILCMAQFLFELEQKNRLEQKGLLKRFSITCYGKQQSLEDIRAEKAVKFEELADKKGSYEYQMWFLKYNPMDLQRNKDISMPSKSVEPVPLQFDIREAVGPNIEVLSQTPRKIRDKKLKKMPKTTKKTNKNISNLYKMKNRKQTKYKAKPYKRNKTIKRRKTATNYLYKSNDYLYTGG